MAAHNESMIANMKRADERRKSKQKKNAAANKAVSTWTKALEKFTAAHGQTASLPKEAMELVKAGEKMRAFCES